jgi:hypothetical protein
MCNHLLVTAGVAGGETRLFPAIAAADSRFPPTELVAGEDVSGVRPGAIVDESQRFDDLRPRSSVSAVRSLSGL